MRELVARLAAEGLSRSSVSESQAWGSVLLIGAGSGAELHALKRLAASRVFLVEPQPRWADELARLARATPGVNVVQAAAVAQGDRTDLVLLSNPRESATLDPEGLINTYPNLRRVGTITVPAVPMRELVESCLLADAPGDTLDNGSVQAPGRHLLCLDAPGQAYELLAAVEPYRLQSFYAIILRAGVEPLYKGEQPVGQTLNLLRDIGFEVVAEDSEAVFPHAAWLLQRDDVKARQWRAQAKLSELRLQLEQSQRETAAVQAERQGLLQAHDRLLAEQAQWVTERKAWETQAREAELRLELLQSAQDALRLTAADQSRFVETLSTDRSTLTKRVEELNRSLAELSLAFDELSQQKASLTAEIEAQAAEQIQLVVQRDALAKELADLIATRDELTQEKAGLVAASNGLVKQNLELTATLEVLATTKRQLLEERDGLHVQCETLANEKTKLTVLCEKLVEEKSQLGIKLEDIQTQFVSSRQQNEELSFRQLFMQEELVKAEAQIELIKELLLREPGV